MYEFIAFIAVVFAVLQIILFFKIWGMTNDVRKLRDFFIEGKKPQTQQAQEETQNEEPHEYDKRLDSLGTGDLVILKSTGQKVKIVKTWGKEIVVSTPTGNECLPKWELEYITTDGGVLSQYPIAHYKAKGIAVYVIRDNEDETCECVSMDGKDTYKLSKNELKFGA